MIYENFLNNNITQQLKQQLLHMKNKNNHKTKRHNTIHTLHYIHCICTYIYIRKQNKNNEKNKKKIVKKKQKTC